MTTTFELHLKATDYAEHRDRLVRLRGEQALGLLRLGYTRNAERSLGHARERLSFLSERGIA